MKLTDEETARLNTIRDAVRDATIPFGGFNDGLVLDARTAAFLVNLVDKLTGKTKTKDRGLRRS